MPPRRAHSAYPQSSRCLYVVGNQRCRRVATVEHSFCRQHAQLLATQNPTTDQIVAGIQQLISGRAPNPLTVVVGALRGYVNDLIVSHPHARSPSPASSPRGSSGSPPRPSTPPPNPPPPPDPLLRAREILGFEPDEPLTRAIIEERRRKLAKVFHPDADPKELRHMQRINEAAGRLLAKYR